MSSDPTEPHVVDMHAHASDAKARIRDAARSLGFDAIGFARADEPLDVEHERYAAFVAAGRHGAMRHLAEHADVRRRLDGPGILDGARSVVCLAKRYARADDAQDPELARGVARYARGRDYHRFLKRRLRKLAAFVATLAPGARARALCDIEPVLERAWAARAGLGFVGKHGLVIVPGQGSYALLGEVVTTLALPPDEPMTERCGTCTRCLDACPTGAFDAPFRLDPRRCIAYLTIEVEGAAPAEIRPGIGEHLFGCDACQEVCPFNKTAPPPPDQTEEFRPLPLWRDRTLADLVRADDAAFDAMSEGSPARRPGRAAMARNAVVVAANRLARDEGDA
ncbi:MAG TPA: tRNA epoxyqueuosine(34) reductase QueG, partial [Minicystis sp.]|nr:tRNA epoxyqueuosine(34) reductase QueG [Minicystis sp.]